MVATMGEFKKSIKCSNCGVDSSFSLGSDFELNEVMIHARCSSCGNSLQINFNIIGSEEDSTEESEEQTEEKTVNLEEELFSGATDMFGEKSSDDIKDLIDES